MPKKVKKGGEGGGRMEGERLQQRAHAEEETAKKKEEILTLFLKDKLEKEERNTALNQLKLNDSWRSKLRQTRQTRAAELSREIDVFSQTFQREKDSGDGRIKKLDLDLEEAEHQFVQFWRADLQHQQRQCAHLDKHLSFLEQQWDEGLQKLRDRHSCDRKQVLDHSEEQRKNLEDAMFAFMEQQKGQMEEIRRHGQAITEDLESISMMHLLEWGPNVEKEKLQDEGREKETEEKSEEEEAAWLEREREREEKLLNKFLIQRARFEREQQRVNEEQVAYRDQVNNSRYMLQEQLAHIQESSKKQLTNFTVHSSGATKRLQELIAKGEKLVRSAEVACQLESKVLLVLPAEGHGQEAAQLPPSSSRSCRASMPPCCSEKF